MPVRLAGSLGITRDVSASSVYFEMDNGLAVGSEITFEIEMATPLGPMMMKCSGTVVRTEQKADRMGLAVKMTDSRLEVAQ